MGAKSNMSPTDHLKSATLVEICQWILKAWQSVLQHMLVQSFKVTGVCNKVDGSENYFLWYQSEESCQEDTRDSELTYFD
jgi:hypothetical protein